MNLKINKKENISIMYFVIKVMEKFKVKRKKQLFFIFFINSFWAY